MLKSFIIKEITGITISLKGSIYMKSDLISKAIKFPYQLHEKINAYAKSEDLNFSEAVRNLCERGLTERVYEENTDLIAVIVRQQLDIVLKPHIERLAKLSSKSGHMSATAAFLNVQALMDLVPSERRKDVRDMYESARKKAAAYMMIRTEDWDYSHYKE